MILLIASIAHAVPEFPAAVQDDVGMPCTPACTLCHETDAGGYVTVTRPFGATLMNDYGLQADDFTALADGLAQMEADGVDTDGDGVPDIEELRNGTDPNDSSPSVCEGRPDPPTYGCLSVTGSQAGLGALLAAMAVGWGRRR